VTLPHGRSGLNARRMAVLETFRAPSLCRHVHRALWRSVVLDVTPIISATACHQSHDVERYSRFTALSDFSRFAFPYGFLVAEAYTNIVINFQNFHQELITFLEFVCHLVDTLVRDL